MRVLHNVTSGEQPDAATLSVDMQVGRDHEYFASADEFLKAVSLEALRNFDSINITACSTLGKVRLNMRWLRSRWATGQGKDATVELVVTDGDAFWAQNAHEKIKAAICRGYNSKLSISSRQLLTFLGTLIVAYGVCGVLLFLFPVIAELEDVIFVVLFFTLFFAIFVGSLILSAWMVPSLEIVPEGGSNTWRAMKKIGPVVVTILLAGLTKQLFG
jgi:hypothetical protein